MPLLPWKTTRASRISQIVADLQSPKRGGSLVVETGFPTSIVDLFVKHRDRLRKHSARRRLKKKKKLSTNEFHDSIPQLPSSSLEINSTDSSGSYVLRGDLEIEGLKVLADVRECRDRGCELIQDRTETCAVGGDGDGDAAGWNGVCLFVLKIFVVAVLALSAKRLVVGITLSAFLLFLLKFVGERAVRFLKPCTHGEAALRSLIQKVSKHLWIGKDDDLAIQDSRNYEGEPVPKVSLDAFLNDSIDSPEFSSSIEEIVLVEPEIDAVVTPKGIEDEKRRVGDEKENKDGGDLQVCENQHGIRRKQNRRMFEKLVRRKSINQAIEKNETLEKEQEQNQETRNIICEDEQQWQAMEVAESCEVHGIETAKNFSYTILVPIVLLVGLFGGRFPAVVLTTTYCFMIKLNKITRRKSLNPQLKVSSAC